MRHTFLLIASIFLLAACSTKTEYPAEFAVADSLADYGEPRKALALLDSMSVGFESWAEPVQMRYSLLKYKAEDKADVPITSDSTILPILNYYEKTQEEWLPEAYYYAGRTYTEIGDAPRALDYYHKAATAMENDERWKPVLARVYAQVGGLFSQRRLVNESIPYFHMAARIYQDLRDSSSLINMYSWIAGEFKHENWDSVSWYNEKATQILEVCHDSTWISDLWIERVSATTLQGNFDEARAYLSKCFEHLDWNKHFGCWSVAARLYDSLGRKDSMEYCLRRMTEVGNLYAQAKASGRLCELYLEQGKKDLAQTYISKYRMLVDSVDLLNNSTVVQEMQSSYNYNIYVRENTILRQKEATERERNRHLRFIAFGILLLGGAITYGLYERLNSQRYKNEARIEKLKSLASSRILTLEETVREKESQLSHVSKKNEYLLKDIKLKRTEIEAIKQQQSAQASQLELERAKIMQTEFARRLLDPSYTLKESDREAIVSYYQENNPKFMDALRSLCTLKIDELTISLLIRMGFNQTTIARLICKEPQTINSARRKLIVKLKGQDARPKDWNAIIESL